MAETLDHQILQIVARESTHQWAYLCHDREEFSICSHAFTELFEELSARSQVDQSTAASPEQDSLLVQPAFPDRKQLVQLLLARHYHVLADYFAPEFDLRFYSLEGEGISKLGMLLFVESRYTIQFSAKRALQTHQASRLIKSLSPREAEVMTMVVAGMTNQSAAVALGLSPKTIEKHRKKMMMKLRVHSVAEVARIAYDAELSVQFHGAMGESQ